MIAIASISESFHLFDKGFTKIHVCVLDSDPVVSSFPFSSIPYAKSTYVLHIHMR